MKFHKDIAEKVITTIVSGRIKTTSYRKRGFWRKNNYEELPLFERKNGG